MLSENTTDDLPFALFAAAWLIAVEGRVRRPTLAGYRCALLRHWMPLIGHLPLRAIRRRDVRDGLRSLLASGRGVNSVRSDHRVLNACLEEAVDEERIATNPARGAARHVFPRQSKPDRALDADQVRRLLQAASGDPDAYDLVALLLVLGCRIGELLGAKWTDFDLVARQFTIARSMSGRVLGPTKSGRISTVEIPEFAVRLLRSRRVDYASTPWIFPGIRPDEPMTYFAARRVFQRVLAQAGLRAVTFHAARHTYCTNLLAFADLSVVMEQATHADVATTRGYIRKPPLRARHALDSFAAPFEAAVTPPRRAAGEKVR